MWKWALAISLLILSLGIAAGVGEYIGLWSVSRPMLDWAIAQPALSPHAEMYRIGRGEWREWSERVAGLEEWEGDLQREAARLREEWARLEVERKALARSQQELEREEARIEQRLAELHEAEERAMNLGRLREIYEAMRPDEAAQVAESLEEETLVALLSAMEARRAAQLLERMEPAQAARLTHLIREAR